MALSVIAPAESAVIGSGDDSLYQARGSYFPSVGQIYGTDASGGFAASGVVIAPNWVLTAAHVTSGATSLNFYLDGGGNFASFSGRTGISALEWFSYSKWDGNLNSGYDIGLVHFTSSLGVDPAILYTVTGEVGMTGTSVGYGMTGVGATGATTFDGLKRGVQNKIDATAITPRAKTSGYC